MPALPLSVSAYCGRVILSKRIPGAGDDGRTVFLANVTPGPRRDPEFPAVAFIHARAASESSRRSPSCTCATKQGKRSHVYKAGALEIEESFVYNRAGTTGGTAIAGANAPPGAAGLKERVPKAKRAPFRGL